jgi:4-amino-4-deoxy-L-arabinose transferase-like glycosyltransferase
MMPAVVDRAAEPRAPLRARLAPAAAALARQPSFEYVLLAAITLLALALRLYKLGAWSFWIDELFTIDRVQAQYSSFEAILRHTPPAGTWLPVSLLFTAGALKLLGVSEWAARLVPAWIGILSIPALYFPIKRIATTRVGLLSVLLLAVSPWHLAWSQNARFYTALLVLYTLALFAIHLGLERDRPWSLVAGIGLLYLALSERLTAAFLVPVVAVYAAALKLLPFTRPPGLRTRNLLLLAAPLLGAALFEGYARVTTGSSGIWTDLGWFLMYRNYTPLRLLGVVTFDIGIPLMCLAALGGAVLLAQKRRLGLLLVVGTILPVAILMALSRFMFVEDRYVFATLPAWTMLAAFAIDELWTQARQRGALLAMGVLLLLVGHAAGDAVLYYGVNNGDRRDWRGAFAIVRERMHADDLVVAYWPEFGPYYLGRPIIAWEQISPEEVVQSGQRVWFVVDSETVWGDLRKKRWIERNAELIEVLYLRRPQDLSLRIYLYAPSPGAHGP